MQLADLPQQRRQIDVGGMEIKLGAAVDQAGGVEQVVDQVRHPQHGGADLAGAFADFDAAQ